MTPRNLLIALGALAAAGVTVLAWPKAGEDCIEQLVDGPCEAFAGTANKALACEPGEMVTVKVQVCGEPDGGLLADKRLIPVGATERAIKRDVAVDEKRAVLAVKAEASDCIIGEWQRDERGKPVVWDGKDWRTSKCCVPGCTCVGRCVATVPIHRSGTEDAMVRKALCKAVPEHASCARDGGG